MKTRIFRRLIVGTGLAAVLMGCTTPKVTQEATPVIKETPTVTKEYQENTKRTVSEVPVFPAKAEK